MRGKPDVDSFLAGGATEKQKTSIKKKGKPKGPEKFTTSIRLSLDVAEVLQANNGGNQSVFIENLLRKYFEEQGLM